MGRKKRGYAVTKRMIELPTNILKATTEKLKANKKGFTKWIIEAMMDYLK